MDGTSRRRGDQQSCRSETSCSTTSKASTADLAWRELKKQDPQKTIDGFWRKFVHKKPGKVFRILPEDLYAKRAAANAPQGLVSAHSTASSFDEAVASCKAKVEKIQRECRLKNQKYTDRHFDIETDLKFGYRECLNGLLTKPYPPGKGPRSVKRVLVGAAVDSHLPKSLTAAARISLTIPSSLSTASLPAMFDKDGRAIAGSWPR